MMRKEKALSRNIITIISVVIILLSFSSFPLAHAQLSIFQGTDGYVYASASDGDGNFASINVDAYFLNDTQNEGLVINLWAYINSTYNGQTEFRIQIDGTGFGYNGIGYTFGCNGPTQNGEIHIMSIISPIFEVPYGALPLNMTVEVYFLAYPGGNTPVGEGFSYMDSNLILGTLQNGLGGGGSCVSGFTPILTSQYTYILAQDISAGVKLMTYNITTGLLQPAVVKEVVISYENSSYVINGNLEIAGDQKVLTATGFIDASNLTLNDTLYNTFTNTYLPVFSIEKIYNPMVMYDFVLSINHNFIGWYYSLMDKLADPCG